MRKICAAPSCSILTPKAHFYENTMSNVHLTCRNDFLELIYIKVDTKITKVADAEAEIFYFDENGGSATPNQNRFLAGTPSIFDRFLWKRYQIVQELKLHL